MDTVPRNNKKRTYSKLSLKKNRLKDNHETMKVNRSSDVILLDETLDSFKLDLKQKDNPVSVHKDSSIIIIDSCDSFNDSQYLKEKPNGCGNVSFNCSEEVSFAQGNNSRPSYGGWSPAQNIISATPRNVPVPSTPKDVTTETLEECSIKKIHHSQKKLLSDLYGEIWKSIPRLFKTPSHNQDNCNGVSKKLDFNDDESDKENIKFHLQESKKLYLTDSNPKQKFRCDFSDIEGKSRKKLYTEKVPNTPEPPKIKVKRNVQSTSKKLKGKSVTELVELLNSNNENNPIRDDGCAPLQNKINSDVTFITNRIRNVSFTPNKESNNERLSFVGSLADNVPSWRCNIEALQYHDNFIGLREKLTKRLYAEFNKSIFDESLDADMPIIWNTTLRTTAGTTTNRLIKKARGDRVRSSSIKLSMKVLDGPQRVRDTLVHEMCHAATWQIDGKLRAGHGPLWKKWATRALQVYPELGEISRCHNLEIHFKYMYKCTKCGYSIERHSKSIDVSKKCCGYCFGNFEVILNRKGKDGKVVSTPARKGEVNGFAKYVKENYGTLKQGTRSHAEVMKILGEQFSANKNSQKSD